MEAVTAIMKGWQCPVCETVWAPFVTRCHCVRAKEETGMEIRWHPYPQIVVDPSLAPWHWVQVSPGMAVLGDNEILIRPFDGDQISYNGDLFTWHEGRYRRSDLVPQKPESESES